MAACAVAARTILSVMSSLSLSLPLGTDAVLAIVDDALMKNVIVVDSRTSNWMTQARNSACAHVSRAHGPWTGPTVARPAKLHSSK